MGHPSVSWKSTSRKIRRSQAVAERRTPRPASTTRSRRPGRPWQPLGQIGLNELPRWPGPDWVEVGWDLHPSVWGQGLATEGARAALRYGFEVVGLERIISTARADNAASRRVMEKCGLAFQEEFTHKGALVAWYAIDRADWQASQTAAS